jgi:hypothetical protein
MKAKYYLLFLPVFFTSLYGCKKTDKSNNVSIVGKWNLLRYEVKIYTNGSLSSDKTYPVTNNFIQFNSDNTGEILEDPAIDPVTGLITYSRSGSDLNITLSDNFPIYYKINSVSATALILQNSSLVVDNTQSYVTYYYTK